MKVYTLGGYDEVGKNMTAVEVDGEIVIFDMGYHMESVVEQDEEIEGLTTTDSLDTGAIPTDKPVMDQRDKVKGIVIGHGHLDHIGAIPKLAGAYDCPIFATPFTMRLIERVINQDRKDIDNELIEMEPGNSISLTPQLELEFVNITHSIPGAVLCSLNTKEGKFAYANDYKLDMEPTLGDKPDFERLRKLGNEDVKAFVTGTTRIDLEKRCKSEKEVQIELQHILDKAYEQGGAVIATTFSSQIARLRNIIKANKGRRKIVMIGRSLKENTASAEKEGLIDLSGIEVRSWRDETEEILREISDDRENYLVICTGNQGEPRAALTRIARGEYPLKLEKGDHVIFSCETIPTPLNEANRYKLEKNLKANGVRFYKDVHTSGHAMKEDHRDMIHMLQPENLIPCHGETERLAAYASLAKEEGYELGKSVHVSQNGNVIEL